MTYGLKKVNGMKATIHDFKKHGNIIEFDHVESIAEVGAKSSTSDTRGIVITLDLDYSINMGISYIQFINSADFSRIEIH